ncbi:MAG: proton-conducting transporter membrane subunit [bacterium]|nr:proton-conducting transporter membrane subunit [bacterium]
MEVNFSEMNYLPWLIPIGPLLAFLIITLATNRSRLVPATNREEYGGHHPEYGGMRVPVVTPQSRVLSIVVGMSGAVAAWLMAWTVFFNGIADEKFGKEVVYGSGLNWLADTLRMGVLVDPLTMIMLFMVPLAVVCIFIYSIGYMAHDPRQARFFSLISLFAGAMLTLVVADNILLLFVGWEVMGLCSYMLIGFWFEKPSAYRAAMKAFMTTRVADVFMLLGIAYLFASTGTLNFRELMYEPAPPTREVGLASGVIDLPEGEAHSEGAEGVVAEGGVGEAAGASEGGPEAAEGEAAGEEAHTETWAQRLADTPALLFGGLGISASALIGLFLIIGTIGKSAQFPLHVWLPDAMEGPTPVSAMIHAAAMVSAGIYAIIRMYPLFEAGAHPHSGEFNAPLLLMAIVGGFTALFAATIAVAQNDVKKVLAYSTISQLGFMMAALGIGAYIAAAFHLITHAFFKALLFMASGSVIHAMEHGEHHVHEHGHGHDHPPTPALAAATTAGALPASAGHESAHGHSEALSTDVVTGAPTPHDTHGHGEAHEHGAPHGSPDDPNVHAQDEHGYDEEGHHFDPQDMMNMGGLRYRIPVTAITFAIGGLSLAGFPLITAGFWSKDEILADAWLGLSEGFGPQAFVFLLLALAAFLTAFYTMRQLCLTFLGEPRTEEARHASLGGPSSIISITMQLPLIVLAVFAVIAGFVGVPPDFPIFGAIFAPEVNPFFEFVKYSLLAEIQPPKPPFNWIPVLTSFGVALGGLALGYVMYGREPLKAGQPDPLVNILGPLHTTLRNKYYIDELYQLVFIRPFQWFAKNVVSDFLDRGVIDGFIHLVARVFTFIGDLIKVFNVWLIDGVGDGIPQGIGRFGQWFRGIQTGRVQQYLLLVLVAALLIGIIFAVSAGFIQAAG